MKEIYYYILLPFAYIFLFIFYTFLKIISLKLDKLIFCSTCFTYFTALLIAIIIYPFPKLLLAMLIGISLTGISIELSNNLKDKWYGHKFLVQLFFTIIGIVLILMIGGI